MANYSANNKGYFLITRNGYFLVGKKKFESPINMVNAGRESSFLQTLSFFTCKKVSYLSLLHAHTHTQNQVMDSNSQNAQANYHDSYYPILYHPQYASYFPIRIQKINMHAHSRIAYIHLLHNHTLDG